ncbi:hypothetical protein [Streptomyces sp. NPDC058374]|uniref:hypothetical protein n=1 Tax=Streptomyces sp. NPDC058374 TaxID=3346466 RepID=UPI003665C565
MGRGAGVRGRQPPGQVRHQFSSPRLEGGQGEVDHVWPGDEYGKQIHLKRVEPGIDTTSA